jgi:hypothetical protein
LAEGPILAREVERADLAAQLSMLGAVHVLVSLEPRFAWCRRDRRSAGYPERLAVWGGRCVGRTPRWIGLGDSAAVPAITRRAAGWRIEYLAGSAGGPSTMDVASGSSYRAAGAGRRRADRLKSEHHARRRMAVSRRPWTRTSGPPPEAS